MVFRLAVVCACLLGASSAIAEDLGPEQAKAFVVGKLFSYSCFDGTTGMGRIYADGSIIGTMGRGRAMRFMTLPAGTLRIEGESMCAHMPGMPINPCFRVQKIDYHSFRGSISGMSFAYCDFHQRNPRARLASHPVARAPATPIAILPHAER
jgi:hypothetical protein